MGSAFIVRRGGGGGLSKCSIIVHIDSGYTVGAFSNSAATTLVKTGKEIGTSGDYVITGLDVGTYYVKAVKGAQSVISNAIMFTGYGIKDVVLSFEVIFYDGGNNISMFSGGSYTTEYGGGLLLNGNSGVSSVSLFNIRNFSTMEVHARKATSSGVVADRCHVGVNPSYTDLYTSWTARASNSEAMSGSTDTIITLDISAITEQMKLCFFDSSSNPMVIRSVYLR